MGTMTVGMVWDGDSGDRHGVGMGTKWFMMLVSVSH